MTTFTREKMLIRRQESEDMANEKLLEMTKVAHLVARHIYSIVVDYSALGPYNSYRYQVTHPKYCTDGMFVMKVVDMLKKAFPDFEVTPDAVGDGNTGVLMHSILVKW